MTAFQKGNKCSPSARKIPVVPKEQTESVRKKRVLDWLEWTTGRPRSTIDRFFTRNSIVFEPVSVSAYISLSVVPGEPIRHDDMLQIMSHRPKVTEEVV